MTLEHPETDIWRRNLETLRLFDPRMARLLAGKRLPGRIQQFAWRADQEATSARLYALDQSPENGSSRHAIADEDPANLDPAIHARRVLFGIGDGRRLMRALDNPDARVLVIEPEGRLLISLLGRIDLSSPIAEGRLSLAIPWIDHPGFSEIGLMETLAELQRDNLKPDAPMLIRTGSTQFHHSFFEAIEASVRESRALAAILTDWGESEPEPQTDAAPTPSTNRPAPAFDVTVISPSCRIFDDLAACLSEQGLRVQLFRVPDRQGVWKAAEWRQALAELLAKPASVTLVRNRSLLETDMNHERLDPEPFLPRRILSWWWDVPNIASVIDMEFADPPSPALAFARDMLPLLPPGSLWLPPGALQAFAAVSDREPERQEPLISFVGQSRLSGLVANLNMLATGLDQLCGQRGTALTADINRQRGFVAIHRYLSGHETDLRQTIDVQRRTHPHLVYFLDYLLSMCLTGSLRIAAVETLAKAGLPIRVHGDAEWLKSGALEAGQYAGLIAPESLPNLYRDSQINLNLNFMQVSSTVNPRVLDIAAAGGTVLTDARPELSWLYPDPAVRPFVFDDLDELPELAETLLARDLSRHKARVQAHTRDNHLMSHRARWLAEWMNA